ncbi:hypothetical protein [Nicoliella spurrieriana]|nr:hypothetical protein [Nicoliella spurrieriana]
MLIMIPQWIANSAYVGIDSLFHMNRFYDAMMQIKTGSYSYFQSFFGFGQSGRVVNAVYGPLFAYLNGLLLLITKNWVRYQIVSSVILLIVSGALMYHLSIKNNVRKSWSVLISICYMFSTPILYWINGQQFTAWGAAFVPLVMLCGTEMMRNHQIKWIKLSLSMTLVLEVHNATSAICAMALIPFFVTGWLTTNHRKQMSIDLLKAIGLTLLLSFNMWGAMLELFSSNHLLPVFPDTHLAQDTLHFLSGTTRLGNSTLIIFIMALVYLIVKWRQMELATRVIILNGLFFLWIPTSFFPWALLSKLVPAVDSVIQNPIRFLVIPYVLLYLAVGIMLSDQSIKWPRILVTTLIGLIMLLAIGKCLVHLRYKNTVFNSEQVLISKRNTHVTTNDPNKLRAALRSDNPQTILRLATKSTPDYMPVKRKISVFDYGAFHPYLKYRKAVIMPNLKAKWRRVKNGVMTVEWVNHSNQNRAHKLPVAKYTHSIVTLNGKQLNRVKITSIGTMIINGKPGVNRLTIRYQSAGWFRVLIWVSIISWLVLIGDGIRRLVKKLN